MYTLKMITINSAPPVHWYLAALGLGKSCFNALLHRIQLAFSVLAASC